MKMKKLIAGLICMATVLTVTAACSKDKLDIDDVTVYQTDAYGETVTDSKGENVTIAIEDVSVEYVTDDKGNKVLDDNGKEATILHYYVTDVDEKGNAVTNENKEPVTKEHTSANKEQTTVGLGNIQDVISGKVEATTVEVETLPEGTTIKENKKLLEKAFSSGKFYTEMSIKNELGSPMTMTFATNGSDIYFGMDVNLMGFKMGYAGLQKDGKSYAIDTRSKKYCESDSSSIGDTSEAEDMMSALIIDKNSSYIQTSVVKSKGVTYICEEYKTEVGTSKYYFDQKTEELKRIEHDNPEAKIVIVVNKFVKNPSASYFSIPSGYKKVSAEEFNSSFENVIGSFGIQ